MSTKDTLEDYGNLYSLPSITDELIQMYYLRTDKYFRDTFRKKIQEVCEKIRIPQDSKENLWEKSIVSLGGVKRHYFNEYERIRLIQSDELKKYMLQNTIPDSSFGKYFVLAEKANLEYNECLANLTDEDYDQMRTQEEVAARYAYSWEEVRQKKLELMIEALYSELFEEIDEYELKKDMEMSAAGGGNDNTAKSVMAYEHLAEGIKYYCKKKKKEEKEEEKEAEKEAEKVTQKPGQK